MAEGRNGLVVDGVVNIFVNSLFVPGSVVTLFRIPDSHLTNTDGGEEGGVGVDQNEKSSGSHRSWQCKIRSVSD